MTARKPFSVIPLMTAFAIIAILLAAYGSAYTWIGQRMALSAPGKPTAIARVYRHQWQAQAFRPAAKVESLVRGVEVKVIYADLTGRQPVGRSVD